MANAMPSQQGRAPNAGGAGFTLETDQGAVTSHAVVIATGGLSIPQIGASSFGYRIAEQFGISMTPLRPALVPLIFAPEQLAGFSALSGIAMDAAVSCNGGEFRENLLITHRGLSGPAILQISSYWRPGLAHPYRFVTGYRCGAMAACSPAQHCTAAEPVGAVFAEALCTSMGRSNRARSSRPGQ